MDRAEAVGGSLRRGNEASEGAGINGGLVLGWVLLAADGARHVRVVVLVGRGQAVTRVGLRREVPPRVTARLRLAAWLTIYVMTAARAEVACVRPTGAIFLSRVQARGEEASHCLASHCE